MQQSRVLLSSVSVLVLLCAMLFVNWIAVFDSDIWWHIKAGEILRQSGMIHTDPFAFTRETLPYLATHEWLSQVVFSIVWDTGGAAGITALRIALVSLSFGFLLALRPRYLGLYAMIALGALGIVVPAIVDRPQLFSFAVFTAELLLLGSALLARERGRPFSFVVGGAFLALQILWVNLHGGACVAGLFIFLAFAAQCLFDAWSEHRWSWPRALRREAVIVAVTGILGGLALIASPSGIGNLSYLWDLLTDNTAQFITEWAPRPFGAYIADTWWLWILAVWSLYSARRFPVFCGILLLIFGILSRQAIRHEPLFAFAFLTVVILNLSDTDLWHRSSHWIQQKAWRSLLFLTPLLIALLWTTGKSDDIVQSHTRRGIGLMEQGKGAFDFIEQNKVTTPVFNSYELGGYFLFRGYPDRKVFVDGRNVDYGYDFLSTAFEAGHTRETWDALEKKYQFSAAAVFYQPFTDTYPFPYTRFLNGNTAWKLVYLDDWTALYIKPDRQPAVPPAYTLLTPELLVNPEAASAMSTEQLPVFEQELARAVQNAPRDINARLQLARLYLLAGFTEDARAQLDRAIAAQPWRYEPYELLGILAMNQQHWEEASDAFAKATSLTGNLAQQIDHETLAEIASKAGKPLRAFLERLRAL